MSHVFHVMDETIGNSADGIVIILLDTKSEVHLTCIKDGEDGKEDGSHCNKTQEDLPSIAFHVCV